MAELDRRENRQQQLEFQHQMLSEFRGQRGPSLDCCPSSPETTTTTTVTSGPGQRSISSFFTPQSGAAASGAAGGLGADIVAALADPGVLAALAAALGR